MITSQSTLSLAPDPAADRADLGGDARRLGPALNGILHEFRNHVAALAAATSELRAEIPPALALRVGDALCETERNVQGLTSLLTLVDASIRTVEPLITELGDVVDRAIRLAAPAAGRRVSITADVPRRVGVKNQGAALECLLALLLLDLARAQIEHDVQHVQLDGKNHEIHRAPHLRVDAELGRRGLALFLESDGARPSPDSWRFLLASELAAKLDAKLVSSSRTTDVASYVVQFR
jgi:hypothetical protein